MWFAMAIRDEFLKVYSNLKTIKRSLQMKMS